MELRKEDYTRDVMLFKTRLNSSRRRFPLKDDESYAYAKYYQAKDIEEKLYRFAIDSFGTISDCFILFAMAKLSVCSKEAVGLALKALKKKNYSFSISCVNNKGEIDSEALGKRLTALYKNGLYYKHAYYLDTINQSTGQEDEGRYFVFTLDRGSQQLMNKKLQKSEVFDEWLQASPVQELLGIASASFVAATIANDDAFVEFKNRVFRTKVAGTRILGNELKFHTDSDYYVTCIPGYLHFDKRIADENMFEDWCIDRLHTIHQYIFFREARKQNGRVVLVVDSEDDLNRCIDMISRTKMLDEYLDRLYITGEGVFRHTIKTEERFMQLERVGDEMELIPSYPDFLAD